MSNLNPFAAKKARHSLLLAAIKDRLGDNVISSSKAADLYAELLGYQNQSELVVKNKPQRFFCVEFQTPSYI